jgi:hypothetical protein
VTRILLTGAGFSRNWGGWLASETFEYLLGCPEISQHLKDLLWKSKDAGGNFEDALADLQAGHSRREAHAEEHLKTLETAIAGMFNAMNQGLTSISFDLGINENSLIAFLRRFDVIFTLNQDLLLEKHYLGTSAGGPASPHLPGIKLLFPPGPNHWLETWTPEEPSKFKADPHHQPYFKLHGSSNWTTGTAGRRLLVMGGNKSSEIGKYELLKWYHKEFQQYLNRSGARLLVIGYSFSDNHINEAITVAVRDHGLELFIIDPLGVDILNKQPLTAPVRVPSPLMNSLRPGLLGASRRGLAEIFTKDRVEYEKIYRFVERR